MKINRTPFTKIYPSSWKNRKGKPFSLWLNELELEQLELLSQDWGLEKPALIKCGIELMGKLRQEYNDYPVLLKKLFKLKTKSRDGKNAK